MMMYLNCPVKLHKIDSAMAIISQWGFMKTVPLSQLSVLPDPTPTPASAQESEPKAGCEICGSMAELKEALVVCSQPRITRKLCPSCIHNFGLVIRRVSDED